ncbi:MAG: retron St85 family RNA-directed DNA polymerase, partial [Clostridiaceae bacterium]
MLLVELMAESLGLEKEYINRIARTAARRYKVFTIPKKNGKCRDICQPSPELKGLQYWLSKKVFSKLPISHFSTAYSSGCSIKKNALKHKKGKFFLHLDLENFFGTISDEHLKKLLNDNRSALSSVLKVNFINEDVSLICDICLLNKRLTIGSVSAPIISNCIMFNFDNEIKANISDYITYTRYADDLVFSSKKYLSEELIDTVDSIILKHGFTRNINKTYFVSSRYSCKVTGLVIDQGKVTTGLSYRRYIKSMVYNKVVHGKGDSNVILGHLNFFKDIEPEYYNKIMLKYSCHGNVLEKLKSNTLGVEPITESI